MFSLFIIVKLNAGNVLPIYQDSSKNIPYQVKYYSSLEGLTQVSVNAMLKDKQGFLWVGTQDGLNRFDGKNFLQFRYNPIDTLGLQGNYIVSLFQDSKDRIWIGTMNKGLSYYEPSTGIFHRINTTSDNKDIINKSNITTVSEDKFGNIWFNSLNHGVFLCNEKGRGFFNIKKIFGFEDKEQATNIYLSTDQNIYISTNLSNIYIAPILKNGIGKSKKLLTLPITSRRNHLSKIDGFLWIGTEYGLWRLNLTNLKLDLYNLEDNTIPKTEKFYIFSIVPYKGKLWVGTSKGAYLLEELNHKGNWERTTLFSKNTNLSGILSNNFVLSILPDSNNIVWIGTAKNLNLLDFNIPIFKTINNKGIRIFDLGILTIHKNITGLWVGTDSRGLSLYKDGKVYYYTYNQDKDSGITANFVTSIAEDKNGYLWIGTLKGVSIVNLKTFDPENPKFIKIHSNPLDSLSLSYDYIKCISVDKHNNIWVSTYGKGLNRFIGDIEKKDFSFQHFQHRNSDKNSISSNFVNIVVLDNNNNNYWIATKEGLDKLSFENNDFAHPRFVSFKHDSDDSTSITEGSAIDISIDKEGILWIGTHYGFNRFDPVTEVFQNFYRKDGLANDFVYSIQEDDFGNIWLGTNYGMSRYNKKTGIFTNFNLNDGILSSEFNSMARLKDDDGNIYLGGIDGLTIFYPKDIKKQVNTYDIVLTGLISKNKNYTRVSDDGIRLDKELSLIDKLNLRYDDFPLSLKFSSPNANPLHFPDYYYKLSSLNKEWNKLNDRNEIQLLKLSPGHYNIQITGGYFGTIWDRKPKKIEIIISPPWWRSILAYLLYLLFLLGLGYFVIRHFYRRKLALEETKKWEHIEEMKSQFYTNITHEFRTPLTVMLGMVEQVKSNLDLFGKKSVSDSLKMIKRNGLKLLDLVNQLLDMAIIEDGKYQINNSKGDIVWFLGFMVENFHSYAQSKNIELVFYPEVNKLIMDFDPKVMERILSNLLGIAIKFSNKGGLVIIHLTKININNKSMLQIKIKDEGIGIGKSKLPYVFDKFYQADSRNERKNEGTGIRLPMVKILVELMDGSINIKSIVGKGSIFTLIFPITTVSLKSAVEFGRTVPIIVEDENIIIETVDDNKDLVLIVEDNQDIAKYISSSISDRYAIKYAENGDLGLKLAINTVPDIIISDVMMPVMDGYEMLEKLKKDVRTSHIPIVMLTARVTKEDKLKGLKYGADAYLTKPFNIEELNVRLEQLILLRKKLQEKYKDPINWNKVKQSRAKSIEQEFLAKIKEKINDNIDNTSLNPEFLAKLMQMSDTQLYRKLKALTDKSTAIFIRYVRIQKSKELLETTDLNISEIAYDIGFNDPAYFSRIFKDEYGLSPSEVRSQKG